jgi:hypothetical protein
VPRSKQQFNYFISLPPHSFPYLPDLPDRNAWPSLPQPRASPATCFRDQIARCCRMAHSMPHDKIIFPIVFVSDNTAAVVTAVTVATATRRVSNDASSDASSELSKKIR